MRTFAGMRIALLADLHLADRPEDAHGVDTRANLSRCVARLRQRRPDLAVLMGDYSLREPRRQDVEWACSRMQLAEVETLAIAGNHDDARHVAEVCVGEEALIGERLYYRRDFGSTRALFLDTSKGYLERQQTDWLQQNVQGARGDTLVFMHHPPVELGVPFMDERHGFRDAGQEVFGILFGGATPVHVFCGHYHVARTAQIGMHSVHACPSTYFQLDATRDEFAVSHALPAMRHVELTGDQVRTWVEVLK